MPISIVIAGDRLLMREALRASLEAAGVRVAGAAATVGEALLLSRASKAQVLLVDAGSQALNAAEAGLRLPLVAPNCYAVALAGSHELLPPLLSAGVRGFLLWTQPVQEIVDALGDVGRGRLHVCHDALAALASERAIA